MEEYQSLFLWKYPHFETKVKLPTVIHGAAVQQPSGCTEKVRDLAHSERRMLEELKLDKGTDSFWNEIWTGAKFLYNFCYVLWWWRETARSWNLFLPLKKKEEDKWNDTFWDKMLTWDRVCYWKRVSILAPEALRINSGLYHNQPGNHR